jgi:hypothetical protein
LCDSLAEAIAKLRVARHLSALPPIARRSSGVGGESESYAQAERKEGTEVFRSAWRDPDTVVVADLPQDAGGHAGDDYACR